MGVAQPLPGSRRVFTATATVAQTGTISTEVDIRHASAGVMHLPAEFNGDTITFHVAEQSATGAAGTYALLTKDEGNSAVTLTGATGWHEIPQSVMAAAFMKVVTGSAAAAAATITFSLKT